MQLLRAALRPRVVRNAVGVALVVGVVLNAVNHGTTFLHGGPLPWAHVLMNFVVPYCVASYSAAKADLARATDVIEG